MLSDSNNAVVWLPPVVAKVGTGHRAAIAHDAEPTDRRRRWRSRSYLAYVPSNWPRSSGSRPGRGFTLDQDEQRSFGIEMAERLQAVKTAGAIKDKRKCFADILMAALAEKGLDAVVSGILQGPPQWSAEALRHIDYLGPHRDALALRAAEDPEAAFYALYHGADVGDHRDALVAATAGDPVWAHMTLREVSDLGNRRESLLAAVVADPRSARFTLKQVSDLGVHREAIAAAASQSAPRPSPCLGSEWRLHLSEAELGIPPRI